jgi:hypothetical protein
MSFNRLIYDPCAYNKRLDQNGSVLDYTLDPNKFYNCNPCRVGFGLVGGNNVSLNNCNLVDVESSLRGQTPDHILSLCPERKYLPTKGCSKTNLRECEMIHYKPRIQNVGYQLRFPACPNKVGCSNPAGSRRTGCQSTVAWTDGALPMDYPNVYRF